MLESGSSKTEMLIKWVDVRALELILSRLRAMLQGYLPPGVPPEASQDHFKAIFEAMLNRTCPQYVNKNGHETDLFQNFDNLTNRIDESA